MNCREFEQALDRFLTDEIGADAASAAPIAAPIGNSEGTDWRAPLERHAAECAACAELLELARLPLVNPVNLATEISSRTGSGACRQAEGGLNEFVCGLLPAGIDRDLLTEHLAHCRACSDLASELERLSAELPRLSIIRPETSLVDDVLRRTLPMSVRIRRWWARTWPRWVRRPRFAIEFAYAATLVVVVIFATPVSPLQAMPERALELARSEPRAFVPLQPASVWNSLTAKFEATAETTRRRAADLYSGARAGVGTIAEEVASWFETADEDAPAQDSTEQETP